MGRVAGEQHDLGPVVLDVLRGLVVGVHGVDGSHEHLTFEERNFNLRVLSAGKTTMFPHLSLHGASPVSVGVPVVDVESQGEHDAHGGDAPDGIQGEHDGHTEEGGQQGHPGVVPGVGRAPAGGLQFHSVMREATHSSVR